MCEQLQTAMICTSIILNECFFARVINQKNLRNGKTPAILFIKSLIDMVSCSKFTVMPNRTIGFRLEWKNLFANFHFENLMAVLV